MHSRVSPELTLYLVVAWLVGLLFTAIVVAAAMNPTKSRFLARGTFRIVDARLDLTALQYGLLSWDGVYEAHADRLDVWNASPLVSTLDLDEGARSSDMCLKLYQVERFYVVGRTTTVKLCTVRNGTRLYLNQRIYLRP